ncbi:MAG TPA: response regulator [Rhodocyclaceae bacterium]
MPVKKILVVDDSPTERHYMVELLTKNGYVVTTAENGEEGIAKAKAEHPDLVLMDVVMPGLNGYQATRTLTRDEATKDIPVIVCTSKGQETDRIWCLRQGAHDYMVKPVNADELLKKIAAL